MSVPLKKSASSVTSQTEIARQYCSENDLNREFVPQSSSSENDFFKILSKPFSGLQNLAIEVNLSQRFS